MNPGWTQPLIPDSTIVAFVGKEPIEKKEFLLISKSLRPFVIQFFRTKYGCEYGEGFWDKRIDGKTPSEQLRQKILDTLIQIKVQQLIAKQYELVKDVTYTSFLHSLERENKRRVEAKQQNAVIYGPVQYSEDVYFIYSFSNLINKLKIVLDDQVFRINEKDLLEAYERDKDRLYNAGYYSEGTVYRAFYDPDNNRNSKENAREAINTIRHRIMEGQLNGKEIDSIYAASHIVIQIDRLTYNDTLYSPEEDNTLKAIIRETANSLKENQMSNIFENENEYMLLHITKKLSLGYRSYTKCRGIVKASCINQFYTKYLNSVVQSTEVLVNQKVYDQIIFN